MITAVEQQRIVDAAVAAMQKEIKELRERIESLEAPKPQAKRSKAA